ncbi:MAG: CoB--CoM heterodisulfide reductase iron-sulfur subunit A family protein [Methanomassiliicoccales archaeon]|nr:CoB--CoM heterodisulfide reductase iron-sulfur subunit A family protein [Methanomassiliicoccales archaeon]NYT15458.1 CoB--CoM heterodisulfide reductase iron-sulfur subunit A family protein [Methanomassiliicoccales archaeon]
MTDNEPNSVLVVGGGIAGIQAALDLAEVGVKVYLVEEDPSIGGKMAQLDKTFPTNDYSICILAPKMVDCYGHPNINVLTHSKVIGLEGDKGDFKVKVLRKATYIDQEKCMGRGDCIEKCPVKGVLDYWELGLSTRKAIYIPFPQAVPKTAVIDPETCLYLTQGKCGICAKVCEYDAINFDMEDEEIEFEVNSVILCPGFDECNASMKTEYGYEFFKNVVSSREFERILSTAGPYEGQLLRPSDKKAPNRIAFLQCVGSRDDKVGNTYCSSVCCMHALKAAMIAKNRLNKVEPHIFFMDVRTVGKEFEDYRIRAEQEEGVVIHRGTRVASIDEDDDENLIVHYSDGERLVEETFDLVVLSVGVCPTTSAGEISKVFGVELNKDGFCSTSVWDPLSTSRDGIYVCGTFSAPKDIPASVAEASGTASKALSTVTEREKVSILRKDYPSEKDVQGEKPRIGVFVCHCGRNIGGVVNVKKVVQATKELPDVISVSDFLYACSQDALELMKEKIEEHRLNRIVIASCSPRTHELLFQNCIREAGLNQYLLEMANIRDQCSWVHMNEKRKATAKANDLVKMAVAKVRLVEPLTTPTFPIGHSVTVIGGGLAGMTSALEIASNGYEVDLIERSDRLGGHLNRVLFKQDGKTGREAADEMISRVMSNDRVTVHLETEIEEVAGFVGNFVLNTNGGPIKAGAIIVATGAEEYQPQEYFYGEDDRVVTQLELAEMMAEKPLEAKNVVMIQCVGSRTEDNPMCSCICCTTAMNNAINVMRSNPGSNVFVFCKDIRTYGLREDLYREACELGVKFIRMPDAEMPEVKMEDGRLLVSANDFILGDEVVVNADLLVLSTGIRPREDSSKLARMLKIHLSKDGFFQEAHMKLRPVEFSTEGIYMAGLAHWPKLANESIAQGAAVASKAMTIIAKSELEGMAPVPVIDELKCRACGICQEVCAFSAVDMKEDSTGALKASVNPALCKGCGSCGAACPVGAIVLMHYTDSQLLAEACVALKEVME